MPGLEFSIFLHGLVIALATIAGGGVAWGLLKMRASRNSDDIKEVKADLKHALNKVRTDHNRDMDRLREERATELKVVHDRIDKANRNMQEHLVESVNINREIAQLTTSVNELSARLSRIEDRIDRLTNAIALNHPGDK